MRSTFKPHDVEEPIDYWINRPAASVLVRLLATTAITPNQVTVWSGLSGIAAGIALGASSPSRMWTMPVGGLLLYLSVLLDCADGQLARLRGHSSMVGRALDGYADAVATAAVFFGFAAFLYRAGHGFLYVNVMGWTAGYSMKWHVHSYDHAKNIYLHNVLPPEERAKSLPTLDEIADERDRHVRAGDRFGALILRGFGHLTRSQRTGWQEERMGLGLPGASTEIERIEYRNAFYETMRLWTWNGLASHLTVLLAAVALTPVYPGAALAAWWFILGPMNLMTFYLRAHERRTEKALKLRLRPS